LALLSGGLLAVLFGGFWCGKELPADGPNFAGNRGGFFVNDDSVPFLAVGDGACFPTLTGIFEPVLKGVVAVLTLRRIKAGPRTALQRRRARSMFSPNGADTAKTGSVAGLL
jgi:hypothetical protein